LIARPAQLDAPRISADSDDFGRVFRGDFDRGEARPAA
jgi:hypothetical protein